LVTSYQRSICEVFDETVFLHATEYLHPHESQILTVETEWMRIPAFGGSKIRHQTRILTNEDRRCRDAGNNGLDVSSDCVTPDYHKQHWHKKHR